VRPQVQPAVRLSHVCCSQSWARLARAQGADLRRGGRTSNTPPKYTPHPSFGAHRGAPPFLQQPTVYFRSGRRGAHCGCLCPLFHPRACRRTAPIALSGCAVRGAARVRARAAVPIGLPAHAAQRAAAWSSTAAPPHTTWSRCCARTSWTRSTSATRASSSTHGARWWTRSSTPSRTWSPG